MISDAEGTLREEITNNTKDVFELLDIVHEALAQ